MSLSERRQIQRGKYMKKKRFVTLGLIIGLLFVCFQSALAQNRKPGKTAKPDDSLLAPTYVGDNDYPKVEIYNGSDTTLYIKLGQGVMTSYKFPKKTVRTFTITSGDYNFKASAQNVISSEGQKHFERSYLYYWKFVVTPTGVSATGTNSEISQKIRIETIRGTELGKGAGSGLGTGTGRGTGLGIGVGSPGVGPRRLTIQGYDDRADIISVSDPIAANKEGKSPIKDVIVISKPKPSYTNSAYAQRTMGVVKLRIVFLASGKIGSVTPVLSLPNGLTTEAVKAARSIRFKPALRDGVPVAIAKELSFSFVIY